MEIFPGRTTSLGEYCVKQLLVIIYEQHQDFNIQTIQTKCSHSAWRRARRFELEREREREEMKEINCEQSKIEKAFAMSGSQPHVNC